MQMIITEHRRREWRMCFGEKKEIKNTDPKCLEDKNM